MRQELASDLRGRARHLIESGQRSAQEVADQSGLAVATLRRFLDDGELSTAALIRLASTVGVARRVRFSAPPSRVFFGSR